MSNKKLTQEQLNIYRQKVCPLCANYIDENNCEVWQYMPGEKVGYEQKPFSGQFAEFSTNCEDVKCCGDSHE